jgi:hypothetical protein
VKDLASSRSAAASSFELHVYRFASGSGTTLSRSAASMRSTRFCNSID